MAVILLREVACVVKVARLAADADRSVEVERELVRRRVLAAGGGGLGLGLDEAVEPGDVLELGVRVEEQSCVIGVGKTARV